MTPPEKSFSFLASRTHTDKFKDVILNPETALSGNPVFQRREVVTRKIDHLPATRADEVVVVFRIAGSVCRAIATRM